MNGPLSAQLPSFPWDTIADAKAQAMAHPDGICDLSVGTPVDPVPSIATEALAASGASWAGYPATWGTARLRAAIIAYMASRWGVEGLADAGVLPAIGTKEVVAWLPFLLGVRAGDRVIIPETAYPTYEVGVRLAGATPVPCDDPAKVADIAPRLIWINSPANPHGAILDADGMRAWVDAARAAGAVLASDECYGEFGWEAEPVSVLDAAVARGSHERLLSVMSLSKRSNVAGFRAGWVCGDATIVTELLELCKQSGMILPGPIQDAMVPLLADQSHVQEQRERYLNRRAILRPALEHVGFRVEHSEGSLYLWVTRDEPGRASVDFLAEQGILAAPGDFYGTAGRKHVRVALTASDERIRAAADRLLAL